MNNHVKYECDPTNDPQDIAFTSFFDCHLGEDTYFNGCKYHLSEICPMLHAVACTVREGGKGGQSAHFYNFPGISMGKPPDPHISQNFTS